MIDYVRHDTTQYQINSAIREIEEELRENRYLSIWDREALREQLDYLNSFVKEEEV